MDSDKTLREEINDNVIYYVTDINIVAFRCYQTESCNNCVEFNGIDKKDCIYYKNGYCNNVIANAISAIKIGNDIFEIIKKYWKIIEASKTNKNEFKKQCEYANVHCKNVFRERKETL